MKKSYNNQPNRKWYNRNDSIVASPLRVLDEKGVQIGILTRDEALAKAREEEKDLVMITAAANPPVVKIIDFRKFLYQQEKKEQEAKKGMKKAGTKDIQLSVFIAEGDTARLQKKAQEFLEEGYQVRVKLMLRGREMAKREMGFERITSFIASLEEATVASPPRMQGRVIFAILVRKKK